MQGMKNTIVLFFGLLVGLIIAECVLRAFNPIPLRAKRGGLCLHRGERYVLFNDQTDRLDRKIVHTKNSLGFRGPEPLKDPQKALTILAVGGSTTECFLLSDGEDWVSRMSVLLGGRFRDVWANNAGIDGNSTFGHALLMNDVVLGLRPKIVLFLIGLNDIHNDTLNGFDLILSNRYYQSVRDLLVRNTELGSTLYYLDRARRAAKRNMGHAFRLLKDPQFIDIAPEIIERRVSASRDLFVPAYKERVLGLVRISRAEGIEPVLVTQPSLFGVGADPSTGIDLERIRVADDSNGELSWKLRELNNEALRDIGKETGVSVIDLARALPKDSKYYYDGYHFTPAGAQKAAEILAGDLGRFCEERFPEYRVH